MSIWSHTFLPCSPLLTLNRVITAAITLLYLSYSIPVVCLLFKGRNNITHGPYWFGTAGLVANWVLLLWTLFSIVIFAFPFNMPAEPSSEFFPQCRTRHVNVRRLICIAMNYVTVVYAIIGVIIASDWMIRARKSYSGQLRDEIVLPREI